MPSTFVGSFTVPAATGNKAVTGVGFTPKAVIFWGQRVSADGATASASAFPSLAPYWGMAISSTSRVVITWNDDLTVGVSSDDATKCIKHITNATTSFAADFVSMDADGFTVNFSTANATAYIVNFMALGGSDLSNVFIKSFTAATATGNQAQTGVGFQPNALVAMVSDTYGGANGGVTIGLGVSSTQRATAHTNYDGFSGSRWQLADKIIAIAKGGSNYRVADLVSLDADGFTFNWTLAPASPPTIYVLCLKGGNYFVGSYLQKTSTGSQSTTGVGFAPSGLFSLSIAGVVSVSPQSPPGNIMMTGAASDATHRAVTYYGSGSDGEVELDRAAFYTKRADDLTPTLTAKADLTSLDSDGFTLNFSTADATAREVVFMAFGATAAVASPLFPPFPRAIPTQVRM